LDVDGQVLEVVKQRYGQRPDAGGIRLYLHTVAFVKEIIIESPIPDHQKSTG
jgi:hypothetical protein